MITLNSTFFSSEFFIAFTLPRAPSSIWISSEREKRDHYWPWVVPQKSSTHLRAQQHHSAENHKMRFHLWILIFIALATDNSVEGRRRKKGLWYKKTFTKTAKPWPPRMLHKILFLRLKRLIFHWFEISFWVMFKMDGLWNTSNCEHSKKLSVISLETIRCYFETIQLSMTVYFESLELSWTLYLRLNLPFHLKHS